MNTQTNTTAKTAIELAREEAARKVAEKLAHRKEQAELALLTSDKYQDSLVEQAIREETTNKLATLNEVCKSIVEENPIYSTTLRQQRKWNPSKRYGLGNQIADLVGLLTGIQYSVKEHNELMLAATGLSKDLIERTIDAFGQLPYYSVVNTTIVEGTSANAATVQECLILLEAQLGIELDKSKVTQKFMDNQYEFAMAKAERVQAEAELADAVQNFVLK